MSIEAVALDMDGVVVHRNKIVPGAVEAIRAVQEEGIPIMPVTSRDFDRCLWLTEPLGFTDSGVFSGGAAIGDFKQRTVTWERRIDQATTRHIVGQLVPYSQAINIGKGNLPISNFDIRSIDGDCFGVWAEIPEVVLTEVEAIMYAIDSVQYHYNHGTVDNGIAGVHITHIEADKYRTTRRLFEQLGINPDNAVAVADGRNDIPLFRAVGLGIAMGNAAPELKAETTPDRVVDDVMMGGFKEAIERFVLQRNIAV